MGGELHRRTVLRVTADPRADFRSVLHERLPQFVSFLRIHPELRGLTGTGARRNCRLGRHAASLVDDFMKPGRRQVNIPGHALYSQPISPICSSNRAPGWIVIRFAGALTLFLLRSSIIVVVPFHIECISVFPYQTYTPAARDANAVLSVAVAPERLEAVARRYPKVIDTCRVVDPVHLAPRPPYQWPRESPLSPLKTFAAPC